jgi:hypothetical protein
MQPKGPANTQTNKLFIFYNSWNNQIIYSKNKRMHFNRAIQQRERDLTVEGRNQRQKDTKHHMWRGKANHIRHILEFVATQSIFFIY